MHLEQNLDFAGDLFMELDEQNKIIPDEDNVEMGISHTSGCGVFLTIYCC